MDGVGTAERQSEDEDRVSGASDDAREIRGPHHAGTCTLVHQGGIVQGTADGSIPVIGHSSEQAAFSNAKKGKEIQLNEAAGKGNCGARRPEVSQHPRHNGGSVEDLHQGEVTQEEVHGGVEGRVSQCEEDDQSIAQQGNHIDTQHTPEQMALERAKAREPQ